jgi:SWIB/MDM2 domain
MTMDTITEITSSLSQRASSDRRYDCIYLQTPWNKMTLDELAALPVGDMLSEDSSLFLWVDTFTAGDAVKLFDKWGITFHSVVQVLNLAEEAAPAPAAATATAPTVPEVEEEPEPEAEVEGAEETAAPAVKAKSSKPRGARVKSIQPPTWWSSKEGALVRPCTEQLWMATRGEGAPIQTKGKPRQQPYQVRNLVEMAKKNSRLRRPSPTCPPGWFTSRPAEFLKAVTGALAPSARILELFGDVVNERASVFGPGIPGGFVAALGSDEDHVQVAKSALEGYGKVALRSVCAKLHKSIAASEDPTTDEAVKAVFIKASEASSTLAQQWSMPPPAELTFVLSAVADHKLANYPSRRKKGKRTQRPLTSDGQPRVKHGIAQAGRVTPELLAFLGEPEGTLIARTEVVKRINAYIKENSLKNKKFIQLDEPLKKLLKPAEDEEVTYFSLCRLLSPLFIKKPKKSETDTEAVEEEVAVEEEPQAKKIKA